MVEHKIIKERYQRMPDDALIQFAKNESQDLTLESFHLLKEEFELRKLDTRIFETVEIDKEIAEATKLSRFEEQTANEFIQTIWKFIFVEKDKGRSNKEIFNSLLAKNINDEYAYMLVESIEPKARELVDSFGIEIIINWIILIAGGILVVLTFNSSARLMLLLWGFVLVIGGVVRLFVSYSKKSKIQAIVKNIEIERENAHKLFQ